MLQAADSKREEFRKYLEKSGVLDTLTKGLVTITDQVMMSCLVLNFVFLNNKHQGWVSSRGNRLNSNPKTEGSLAHEETCFFWMFRRNRFLPQKLKEARHMYRAAMYVVETKFLVIVHSPSLG